MRVPSWLYRAAETKVDVRFRDWPLWGQFVFIMGTVLLVGAVWKLTGWIAG